MHVPTKLLNFLRPVNSKTAILLDVLRDLPLIVIIPSCFHGLASSLLNCDHETIGYNLLS